MRKKYWIPVGWESLLMELSGSYTFPSIFDWLIRARSGPTALLNLVYPLLQVYAVFNVVYFHIFSAFMYFQMRIEPKFYKIPNHSLNQWWRKPTNRKWNGRSLIWTNQLKKRFCVMLIELTNEMKNSLSSGLLEPTNQNAEFLRVLNFKFIRMIWRLLINTVYWFFVLFLFLVAGRWFRILSRVSFYFSGKNCKFLSKMLEKTD